MECLFPIHAIFRLRRSGSFDDTIAVGDDNIGWLRRGRDVVDEVGTNFSSRCSHLANKFLDQYNKKLCITKAKITADFNFISCELSITLSNFQ